MKIRHSRILAILHILGVTATTWFHDSNRITAVTAIMSCFLTVGDNEGNPADRPKEEIKKEAIENRSTINLIIDPGHMLLVAVGALLHKRLPASKLKIKTQSHQHVKIQRCKNSERNTKIANNMN